MPRPPLTVSKAAARRFLLARQGLTATPQQPAWRKEARAGAGAQAVLARLEAVQIDPVLVLAPNQHLVLRNRVGRYRPAHLDDLLACRLTFESIANARCVLPMERWPLFAPQLRRRAELARQRHPEAADACAHVLARLEREGPLAARHFESEKTLGFWDLDEAKTKLTSLALELLWAGGEIVLTHRDEGERYYDLTERVVPADLLAAGRAETEASARDGLARAYCRAYGLISPTGPHRLWQLISTQEAAAWFEARTAAGELVPVRIEGVRRPYLVAACDVEALRAAAGWAPGSQLHLLPPLDNLLWDRRRVLDLWDFDYTWEIYTPAAKRRFGPYTLPVLQGDRFVGRIDCRADRNAGRLIVGGVHWEPTVQSGVRRRAALERALADLAAFLGLAYDGAGPAV